MNEFEPPIHWFSTEEIERISAAEKPTTVTLEVTRGVDVELNFETGEITSNLPEQEARELADAVFPQWIRDVVREGEQ